ncbi:MAG: hypothetical protein L0H63_06695 [Nitrococcus sp.]|nr:hypothetical protein [Nitrococcus sp.]
MRNVATIHRLLRAAVLLLALGIGTSGFAAAQSGSGASLDALDGPTRQKLLDTRAKLEEIHRQLAEISAAAMKSNPALQEQEEKLRHLVLNTMTDAGYEPEKEIAHIKELSEKLRSEDIDTEQKKRLLADYQQTQTRLLAAEQEALANKEVQQARQAYQDQMRQAMEKEDPGTEALLQRYDETQMELQRQIKAALKSQGADK